MTSLNNRLLEKIRQIIDRIGLSCLESVQDHRHCHSMSFKISVRKMICYVLFENRDKPGDLFNFAFRLRSGDHPRKWKCRFSKDEYFNNIVARIIMPWSAQRGYDRHVQEPGRATEQFGFLITEPDMQNPKLDEILEFFIRTANAAMSRKWNEYLLLTQNQAFKY